MARGDRWWNEQPTWASIAMVTGPGGDRRAAARQQAPGADLVVIGPVWPGGGPPAGVRNNRDVIRSTAEAESVRFLDPRAEGWLPEDDGLVAEDGVHLTDAGQAALADLVQPVVEEMLAATADE